MVSLFTRNGFYLNPSLDKDKNRMNYYPGLENHFEFLNILPHKKPSVVSLFTRTGFRLNPNWDKGKNRMMLSRVGKSLWVFEYPAS